jgi:hypothetical protein
MGMLDRSGLATSGSKGLVPQLRVCSPKPPPALLRFITDAAGQLIASLPDIGHRASPKPA